MNYYILQQDPRIMDQAYIMDFPETTNPLDLIDGKKLQETAPLRLHLSPRSGKFRGCIIGGLGTLFHERFIAELNRIGIDNIQYFPVELTNPEGDIEHSYSLINIIGLLEAVNEKESVIDPMPGGLRGRLCQFKIDPEKAKGHRIFRILEAPSLIIIDETLQENLVAFGPAGVWMLPTEHYDGWG